MKDTNKKKFNPWYFLVITIITGFCLSFLAFFTYRTVIIQKAKEKFFFKAFFVSESISNTIQTIIFELKNVEKAISDHHTMDSEKFKKITLKVLESQNEIQKIIWTKKINSIGGLKTELSKAYKEKPDIGKAIQYAVSNLSNYYPIILEEPFKQNEQRLGINLAGDIGTSETIKNAVVFKKLTIGKTHGSANSKKIWFQVVVPIYKKALPQKIPHGLLISFISLENILKNSADSIQEAGYKIQLYVKGEKDKNLLFKEYYLGENSTVEQRKIKYKFIEGFKFNTVLNIADRIWHIDVSGTPELLSEFNFYNAYFILLLGITITLIITLYLKKKIKWTLTLNETLRELKAAQTKLVQSEKMAGLGTLVAGIAHEINNPVNVVHANSYSLSKNLKEFKTFLFNLMDEDEDEEIKEQINLRFNQYLNTLEDINDGSSRIKAIINDLRTFTYPEKTEKIRTSVTEIIRASIRLVRAHCKYNIKFIYNNNDIPEIECWPDKLYQVLVNILINSCQAIEDRINKADKTYKGKIEIENSTKGDLQNQTVEIKISDNGIGMSEEVKRKIFDPFFTTKEVGKGSGMGLAISYGIIEKHKGTIDIDSHPDEGTEITLNLPANAE
jgi:signal transduction histidine kinase